MNIYEFEESYRLMTELCLCELHVSLLAGMLHAAAAFAGGLHQPWNHHVSWMNKIWVTDSFPMAVILYPEHHRCNKVE